MIVSSYQFILLLLWRQSVKQTYNSYNSSNMCCCFDRHFRLFGNSMNTTCLKPRPEEIPEVILQDFFFFRARPRCACSWQYCFGQFPVVFTGIARAQVLHISYEMQAQRAGLDNKYLVLLSSRPLLTLPGQASDRQ